MMTEVGSRKKINSVKHLFEELVALRLISTLGDFKHLGAKGGGLEPPKPPPFLRHWYLLTINLN